MQTKRPTLVNLVSLGCPKNLVDSEKMLALLAGAGCVINAPMAEADVIVVNTCGFIAAARAESLAVLREAVACKRTGRARRVVVAGCLSNRDGRKLRKEVPGVDAILGVNDRQDIVRAVMGGKFFARLRPAPPPHLRRGPADNLADEGRFRLTPRHTAYLRISEGCSQKCTFCTIPSIRGPFRSKPPRRVLAEARELIADGAVELNIIGQDTTSYGLDLPGRVTLAGLLRQLDRLPGVRWIRLMYAYPIRFHESLVRTIARAKHVVPYVDLPLQHIADPVLRRMGRRVTKRTTIALLQRLRREVPTIRIRSTFIVGFPGETEEDFRELLALVKDFRFDALGVFEFSPEEGTPAARLPGQVPPAVARRRAQQLMAAQQALAFAATRNMKGRPLEVLVDGVDSRGRCVGRYFGQAPEIDSVCLLSSRRPPGTFHRVRVVAGRGYDLLVRPD